MAIYVILLLVIILGILINNNDSNKKGFYCFIVFAMLLIIAGLRDFSLGNYDTEQIYVPRFTQYMNYSFDRIIDRQSKDTFFYLVVRFICEFTKDLHVVIFILSIPFLVSVTAYINKYSKVPWLSFILFLGLGYFGMSFYLLRQVVAMSLILVSYRFVLKRDLKMFIITVFAASMFHQTALIFLIVYLLFYISFSIKQIIFLLFGLVISSLSQLSVMQRLMNILNLFLSDTSRYDLYTTRESGLNYTGFLIQLCVLICVLVCLRLQHKFDFGAKGTFKGFGLRIKKECFKEKEYNELTLQLNLLCLSLFFMLLSPIVGEFWRVAGYFGVFSIVLLPNAISGFSLKNNSRIISMIVATSFTLYFLFVSLGNANMIPYKFFWM